MSVRCFTRDENNGIHVIFPVEGPLKQNCLLVNDSVQFAFDAVRTGVALPELRRRYLERAEEEYRRDVAAWDGQDEDRKPKRPRVSKVLFDLYRILLSLKDHAICDYSHGELRSLLPQGTELRSASQIMPVGAIEKTWEFLTAGLAGAAGATGDGVSRFLFALPAPRSLPPGHFSPEQIARRHLGQQEVFFVQLDAGGEVEACTVVSGFAAQPYSLVCTFAAGRCGSAEEFRRSIGSHFARVCGLLSVVTLSPMIRFPLPTGPHADVHVDAAFHELIGELGFRKSLDLADELGEGDGLVAYDKTLL
jgi:hypothetical protein